MASRSVTEPEVLVEVEKCGFLNDTATCDCAARLYTSSGTIFWINELIDEESNKSE